MTTIILLITSLASAQEQQETFIDFEEVELTGEIVKPRVNFVIEVPRPEADLLILDIRQFVLDKEQEERRIQTFEQQNAPLGC